GLDEVVDIEVDILPHLLDSADDLPRVRFSLQLRGHAKVEVELAVGGRHPDHLGGHRLLEPDHGGFDRHDLAFDADLEVTLLEGLLDLVRGPRLEELHNLVLQHAVGLADCRRIGLDHECHTGELLRLFQDGQGFRIRLLEEDAPQRLERGRGASRSTWYAASLSRSSASVRVRPRTSFTYQRERSSRMKDSTARKARCRLYVANSAFTVALRPSSRERSHRSSGRRWPEIEAKSGAVGSNRSRTM